MKEVKNILVAIDYSAMSNEALKRAISIAKKKDAQLIVMHAIEPSFIELPFLKYVNKDKIKQQVTEKIDQLNTETNLKYILLVESGLAVGTITRKAQETKADLLIIGTHGKDDISSNHFGSTALKLIQNTHIPVLVIKNEFKNIYQKMIAPTNLSDYSKESILFANALFPKLSRKYLYAWESIDEIQALRYRISPAELYEFKTESLTEAETALEKFVEEVGGGEMELINYEASINENLLAFITKDQSDLLVLGSKGVKNLNSFVFGSTASYLIQSSPIDVLAYVPIITGNK